MLRRFHLVVGLGMSVFEGRSGGWDPWIGSGFVTQETGFL